MDVSSSKNETATKWPSRFSLQFDELVRVLQLTGAILRVAAGAASEEEQSVCRKNSLRTYNLTGVDFMEYLGRPIKIRVLLRLPTAPSIRLRTVIEEAVQGAKLRHIGAMTDTNAVAVWNDPPKDAPVLPDYAARVMMLEPELYRPLIGVETCEEEIKKIPANHKNTKSKRPLVIGRAVDNSGYKRKMTIGEKDLKRHYQIVGQTGTGKSTLLATIILNAIEQGYGLTFFDPHGSTIDVVLRSVPEKYVNKIRVVRIGDADNPVPFNIWDSDDPEKEERNINDLCELFSDIFDPKKEGIVGPRYERWLNTFAKASLALLGKRASLESIAVIAKNKDNMLHLFQAISKQHPDLAATIRDEYGKDKSEYFNHDLGWYLCKFDRLTSVEQLRKTLGASTNALDFPTTVDTDTVTLIDLASPTIGTQPARIIGTLILMKLWNALMARKERERTHLVIVDEASLFQTNPMPRMLAESRKFGVSMILCHQHTGQLTKEIRDALEANSANFSAFRMSPRDAAVAAIRLDDPEMQVQLSRLDAFNAITTLSVDGRQTSPFTLEINRPKAQKDGEKIAEKIEANSIQNLVEPYRRYRALTVQEIQNILEHPELTADPVPEWIEEWDRRRNKLKFAG